LKGGNIKENYKWKVIKYKSRNSAVINGRSRYSRKYIKGKKVYASKGTLGIMVFTTKKAAEEFANNFNKWLTPKLIVIRVKPIGIEKNIHHISRNMTTFDLDNFYSSNKHTEVVIPPNNTMGYSGVLVVD